jgi:hypothetical protein
MKIDTAFILDLKACVTQMGAALQKLDLTSQSGIKVKLSDIKSKGGLLSYDDHQVVVFIPDHSYKGVPAVEKNHAQGNKYHFAECITLDDMRASGKYEHRYSANNNPDGHFRIFDNQGNNAKNIALMPCQNCLKHINYQGFSDASSTERHRILSQFSVIDLLSTYSTWFKNMPGIRPKTAGYTADWQDISLAFRRKKKFTCECCGVNLNDQRHLLHTHHINSDKQNNYEHNLKALCIDCHRKEHRHDHMLITPEQMHTINQLRMQQGLLKIDSWQSAYRLADEALHGVLKRYERRQPQSLPHVYHPVTSGVILDVAWPSQKVGIYVDISERQRKTLQQAGWSLMTIGQVLEI